jgi:AraC family L-rhamnose operon regulatory protein RhaS
MERKFKLSNHQKHSHLNFAFVDGDHQSDFAMHKHDFSELFLVVEGTGIHQVSSHQYSLQTGDVFVINRGIEHGFRNVKNLKLINLMFDDTNPFFELPTMRMLPGYQALFKIEPWLRQTSEYPAKLTLDKVKCTQAFELMENIRTEYLGTKSGFEIMINSYMQQLVVLLSREYQLQESEIPSTTIALSRALIYVEQNYSDVGINSEKIANSAFISKRQLERLFKKFFNTSPNRYLRSIQLQHAKSILESELTLSVSSVAEQSGFSDPNYFSKCFKKKYGFPPNKFVKS